MTDTSVTTPSFTPKSSRFPNNYVTTATVPIPLQTLTPGTTIIASMTPDASASLAYLFIDRTVAGGLNVTVGPDMWAFHMELDCSMDGGNTWTLLVGGSLPGEILNPPPASSLRAGIPPGAMLQATFTVPSGVTSLAIQGALGTS